MFYLENKPIKVKLYSVHELLRFSIKCVDRVTTEPNQLNIGKRVKLRLHLYKKHLKVVFVPIKISNNDIRSFDVSFTYQIYSLAISNNDSISNICCRATVLIILTFITRLTTLLPKFLILTHKRCGILTMSSIRGYIWIGAVI